MPWSKDAAGWLVSECGFNRTNILIAILLQVGVSGKVNKEVKYLLKFFFLGIYQINDANVLPVFPAFTLGRGD